MRHAVKGRKLGRTTSHREALFRNQLQSLMDKERIITTLPKAKELRPLAERVITRGKQGTVHARRWALRWLLRRSMDCIRVLRGRGGRILTLVARIDGDTRRHARPQERDLGDVAAD